MNAGLPFPLGKYCDDNAARWFCTGFDAFLADDGSTYTPIEAPESYLYGSGVNRVCGKAFRAY